MSPIRAVALAVLGLLVLGSSVQARADHIDTREIVRVLPMDAIPAITAPRFEDDPGWLPPEARVIGVAIQGDVRAYPIAILNWHEIVNDVVGGRPIAVTFCPLCGTGIAFDRVVGPDVLEFRVSGMLYRNDLLMFDTLTSSLWAQLLGEAIVGDYHGTQLALVSASTLPWGEWRAMHPEARLLDRPRDANGTFLRDYDANPYAGYDTSSVTRFPVTNTDPYGVLHPKEIVLGVFRNPEARAYPESVMAERRVANDVLGGEPILVTYAQGVMKAWDRDERIFTPATDSTVRDPEGREYDAITGAGPDGGLREVPAVTAFWFAWYDFFPATTIYGFFGVGDEASPSLWENPLIVGAIVVGIVGGTVALLRARRRGLGSLPRARRRRAR